MQTRLGLLTRVLSFTSRLVEEAQGYQDCYEQGDLGLYLHIMLKMFVETRGAEDFETLGDTHAREQFASHFEELEPIHAQLNSSHLEMTLVSACIADMKEYYEEVKDLSEVIIFYASFRKHYFGDDFLTHVTSEDVILAEIAEELQVPTYRIKHFVEDFRSTRNENFRVHTWRDSRFIDEFEEFVAVELARGIGG